MSFEIVYHATCHGCSATKAGNASAMDEAGWVMLNVYTPAGSSSPIADALDTWANAVGNECACPDCYAKYQELQKTADAAQQAAYDALGKFTPTPSPSGGSGAADDPYTFEAGVVCVLNAYYRHGDHVYVYMPADAEAKSYDSWEAAEADFAIWDEDTTETSETA